MDSVVKNLGDCVTVFQLLGHFYFSFKNVSPKTRDHRPDLRHTIYLLFLLIFLASQVVLFSIAEISSDYVKSLTAKTLPNLILINAFFFGLLSQVCIGAIQSYLATPLTKTIILNSIRISEMCQVNFQHFIDHKAIRDRLVKLSSFLAVYFVGTASFQYLFSKLYLNESSTEVKNITTACPILFLTTLVVKFLFHVHLVNTHLEAVCTIAVNTFPKYHFAGVVNGIFVKPVKAKLYQETTSKLQTISRIYLLIVENAELVNRSMGITLFAVTATSVTAMISGVYRIFMAVIGANPVKNIAGT